MNYKHLLSILIFMHVLGWSFARQGFQVSGVISEGMEGTPLPGVNIVEQGTRNGTITDVNGEYILEVSTEEAVLEISYVGYLTEQVAVDGRSKIDVTLVEDIAQLDEVLVIGYGSMKKSDLTAAVISLDEEELKKRATTSFESALQGKAAGVYVTQNNGAPGGNVSVTIRGISSLSGSNEPLYVVDGVPIFNDNTKGTDALNIDEKGISGQRANLLATLNPDDIASIEILKDAAASAVYGARASNGVVLITTKRGQQGEPQFSFSSYYGVQNLAKKLELLDSRDYAILANERTVDFRPGTTVEELPFQSLDSLPYTDWQDALYRQGTKQNYQLSVNGGNDRLVYAFSGGYYNEEGIFKNSDFQRFSIKSNLDFNIGERLKIGSNITLSQVEDNQVIAEGGQGLVFRALSTPPTWEIKNEEGVYQGPPESILWLQDNPLAEVMERTNFTVRKRVLGNVFAELDILKHLKFRSNFGYNILNTRFKGHVPTVTTGGRPLIRDAKARKTFRATNFWLNENYFTYNRLFADKHDLTMMIGNTSQYENYESLSAFGERLPSSAISEVTSTTNTETRKFSGSVAEESLLSYYGRLIYKYDNKLILTGIIRRDGSSKFGPKNKWSTFPSVSLAYKLSEEGFIQNNFPAISQLKLRLGYGQVGNQEIGNYLYSATLEQVEIGWNGIINYGQRLSTLPNPNLKWETSIQKNVGLDLGLWQNKLQVIAEYYHKLNKDMLIYKRVLFTQGGALGAPPVNAGDMENEGVEMTVISNNVNRSDFFWKTSFNMATNTNKVLRLEGEDISSTMWWLGAETYTIEKESAGQYYGWVTEGIFRSEDEIKAHAFQNKNTSVGDVKFKDINGDNVVDEEDRTFIGNPFPKYTFGMSNEFGYKNFELSVFLQGVADVDAYNVTRAELENMYTYSNQLNTVKERFVANPLHLDPQDPGSPLILEANTDASFPKVTTSDPNRNTRISDRYVEEASYLKVKNVTLSYNLPPSVSSRINASNVRLYIKTDNLFTFTNYSGYDPEIGAFNQNLLLSGIDYGRYPIPRSFIVGVNLTF